MQRYSWTKQHSLLHPSPAKTIEDKLLDELQATRRKFDPTTHQAEYHLVLAAVSEGTNLATLQKKLGADADHPLIAQLVQDSSITPRATLKIKMNRTTLEININIDNINKFKKEYYLEEIKKAPRVYFYQQKHYITTFTQKQHEQCLRAICVGATLEEIKKTEVNKKVEKPADFISDIVKSAEEKQLTAASSFLQSYYLEQIGTIGTAIYEKMTHRKNSGSFFPSTQIHNLEKPLKEFLTKLPPAGKIRETALDLLPLGTACKLISELKEEKNSLNNLNI